jgi:hypothetical protein
MHERDGLARDTVTGVASAASLEHVRTPEQFSSDVTGALCPARLTPSNARR